MSCGVVSRFPCKPGQVEAMGDLFGAPLIEGRWDSILASVDRLGIMQDIYSKTVVYSQYQGPT